MAEKEKKEAKASEQQAKEERDNSLLTETLKEIERAYGKGSVMRLGDRLTVETGIIPTVL